MLLEQRMRALLERAFDAFLEIDEAELITGWSARSESTFGWSRAEVVGRHCELITPPRLRETLDRTVRLYGEVAGKAVRS